MSNTEQIWKLVDAKKDRFIALSDRIFDAPEIAYAEHKSAQEHAAALASEGFSVSRGDARIPTAVIGEAGESGPVIAILGEFDALPDLSQKAGVADQRPVETGGPGHGCGHNMLGAAALLAATAVKDWLAEKGIEARVRYYGCPAEEGGAAKTFMVRDGLFDDVDAAISWHPATFTAVNPANSLANARIDYTFFGRAAHASSAPELGRSALDAAELTNIGVNYLREHMPAGARIHYAYQNAGGMAENIIPAMATVRQLVRSRSLDGLRDLIARVDKIAEGAALMTETRMKRQVYTATSNLLGNQPLEEVMQANLERLGPVPFGPDDAAFAEQIRATLSREDIAASFRRVGLQADPDIPLCDFVAPLGVNGSGGVGSTDVGDVSWVTPTVQARVATCAVGTPFHSWQLTAQGKSGAAHKGLVYAAKVMAGTAIDLIQDAGVLKQARTELEGQLSKVPYRCPIPDEVQPPVRHDKACAD